MSDLPASVPDPGPSLADSEGPDAWRDTRTRFVKFMARAIYCCIEFACAGQLNRFKVKINRLL